MQESPLRHTGYSDYTLWSGRIETAGQEAMLTESYGNFGLDGAGPNWRVYADPAGKPFCLVWTV